MSKIILSSWAGPTTKWMFRGVRADKNKRICNCACSVLPKNMLMTQGAYISFWFLFSNTFHRTSAEVVCNYTKSSFYECKAGQLATPSLHLKYLPNATTWYSASALCKNNGLSLASPDSSVLSSFVVPTKAWIDMHYVLNTSTLTYHWVRSDGSSISSIAWGNQSMHKLGYPDKEYSCGFIDSGYVYNDACSSQFGTACDCWALTCRPCNVGSFALVGASVCAECQVGSAASISGASACSFCSAGTYSTTIGMQNCSSCPLNSWSLPGSSGCSANHGFYNLDAYLLAYYTFNPGSFLADSSGHAGSLRPSKPPPEPLPDSMAGWPNQYAAELFNSQASTGNIKGENFLLPPLLLPVEFSICLWHLSTSRQTVDWESILDFGNGAPFSNVVLTRLGSLAELRLQIFSGPNVVAAVDISAAFPPASWVHFCLRVDQSGAGAVFIDSTFARSLRLSMPRNLLPLYSAFIGQSNWWNNSGFSGAVDELRVYNRALSYIEIQAVYAYRGNGDGTVMPLPCPINSDVDSLNGTDFDLPALKCCINRMCFEYCPAIFAQCPFFYNDSAVASTDDKASVPVSCLKPCGSAQVSEPCEENGANLDCSDGVYIVIGLGQGSAEVCQLEVIGGDVKAIQDSRGHGNCSVLQNSNERVSPGGLFTCAANHSREMDPTPPTRCEFCSENRYAQDCTTQCHIVANCSGHGRCAGLSGLCRCFSGWVGAHCSVSAKDACLADADCGGPLRGFCGDEMECVCVNGYAGIKCEQCEQGRVGTACQPERTGNRTVVIPGLESLGPVWILLPNTVLGVPSWTEETTFQLPSPYNAVKVIIPAGVWNYSKGRRSAVPMTVTIFEVENGSLLPGASCGPIVDLGPQDMTISRPIWLSMPCNCSSMVGHTQAVFQFSPGQHGSGWILSEYVANCIAGSPVWVSMQELLPYEVIWLPLFEEPVQSAVNVGVLIGALIGGGSLLSICALAFLGVRSKVRVPEFSARCKASGDAYRQLPPVINLPLQLTCTGMDLSDVESLKKHEMFASAYDVQAQGHSVCLSSPLKSECFFCRDTKINEIQPDDLKTSLVETNERYQHCQSANVHYHDKELEPTSFATEFLPEVLSEDESSFIYSNEIEIARLMRERFSSSQQFFCI